ncbi:2-oxo-4-hydroxy-4-carboxy-5-ureidoimidazoline decarboxylase [Nesterenkonia ebinurensis]|uniref:2-oxo-4-hydroxy-4-carboxy-5-ureidoimidazoline decarboxylase n=1 Tax=Nesterenkonia ebinurensis TaxID=2608252 RepID=UPI001CC5CDB1|nr:2-oxo-4-hydroxy-4-carboxy-5-ureidoimidazoline decarboxylase [Nesterenkonia ebinurensis]
MSLSVEEFNVASAEAVGEILATCAPIASWRAGILARRPYSSLEQLLETAAALAEGWTDQEVDAALAHHPRIGEKAAGESVEARASRAEQGSLSEDERAQQEWLAANKEYEERFDRIFLIRARGRSHQEMLAQLRGRLENDADAEARIRREQLAEIALLRLADAVTS